MWERFSEFVTLRVLVSICHVFVTMFVLLCYGVLVQNSDPAFATPHFQCVLVMTSVIRRAVTRPLVCLPRRGGGGGGNITPIAPNFPLTSEKVMGPHGFGRTSYTFWNGWKLFPCVHVIFSCKVSGIQITSGVCRIRFAGLYTVLLGVVGGIHNPTIDPFKHFNTQDRFDTVSWQDWLKCFAYPLWNSRVILLMVCGPIFLVNIVVELLHRREPMEIFLDREEFFKDYNSFAYGVYFDHHQFSHQLCHRRANKWGYAGLDILMEHDDHGHGHGGH